MKKIISFIVILLIVAGIVAAVYLSQETKKDQSAESSSAATLTPYKLNISYPAVASMEVPFYLVVSTNGRQLSLTTAWTFLCKTLQNPLTEQVELVSSNCKKIIGGDAPNYQPSSMPTNQDWRRNYNGTFTLHVIGQSGSQRVYAINHGENKNEIINGEKYQNTVNTNVLVDNCFSGVVDGAYHECNQAYSAFINLSWQTFDAEGDYGMEVHNDEGPIIWPSNGYTFGGVKSSKGVRHPHGFVDSENGYFYVFFDDLSNATGNRGKGIKVARAKIEGNELSKFSTLCDGNWVQSLPVGFDKSSMNDFFSFQGGCSSPILPVEGLDQISFAVAKSNEGGYLGIEEIVLSDSSWNIRLYKSNDLTNWTQVSTVISKTSYADGMLHYPVFLDSAGQNNELVDPADFYLIGSASTQNSAYALHMSLAVGETQTCTTFTYSDWSTCTNGQQTRTVTASLPTGCIGGSPVLAQICGNSSKGEKCIGQDSNGDGEISLVDLSNLLSKYNTNCEASDEDYGVCGGQDSNNDGKISLVDLSNLLSKYNKNCE